MEQIKVEFKNKTITVSYNPHATVKQLVANVGVALSKNPNSIRLVYQPSSTQKPISLSKEGNTLQDYSIPPGSTLRVKDLGLQIGYRTVFLAEYLGPLSIWWIVLLFPHIFYDFYNPNYEKLPLTSTQKVATAMWTVHYTKRILESIFLHKFSHATMPLFNLFKNCTYYWMFSFLIAYVILHSQYTAPPFSLTVIGVLLFCICEACNFMFHHFFLFS